MCCIMCILNVILSYGEMGKKNINLFCNTAAKRCDVAHFTMHAQTCFATNKFVTSNVNTDF